jgi:putative transposase
MRQRRIKGEATSFYHCMSRVVEGRFLFRTRDPGSIEAEHFLRLMRRLERACQVQVLTYTLMSNHFHLLCKVSPPRDVSDDELLDCIEQGYGPRRREQVAQQLADYRKDRSSGAAAAQELRQTYVRRLFDISVFMKELKGRFAQWYNRRHSRYGVLWAERFKSVLLEAGPAVQTVAAYIDLNAVRAGLCEDPKDYRYCGYAEAVAKASARAKHGLRQALGLSPEAEWKKVGQEYRKLLFVTGSSPSRAAGSMDTQAAQRVVEQQQGKIPLPELLRCRIRYFTDGGILGSRAFVQEQFARFKRWASPPKKNRAHPMPGLSEAQIWVLRDLRVRPIG